MAEIVLLPAVADDLERVLLHLRSYDVPAPDRRVRELIDALDILSHAPLIGRPVRDGTRELIVGTGTRGYIARYRYSARDDRVEIVAIRAQREAGFKR